MSDYDVVIRGGEVIDGTGQPSRQADIAITGSSIAAVGTVDGSARRVIDADGLLVTPGFVDIHTHYDGQASWDDRMVPSSWHGVTTVVGGNCGVGFAPVHDRDHDRLIELMEGVEDIPGSALHEGLRWGWRSFPEFLDAVGTRSFDVDVALQVPHAALRLHVMGERGARREPATDDDIEDMAWRARQAVEAGALGFTTSRTMNHRSSRGELTPTLTAEANELLGIAAAIGESGLGVLQAVSDFVDVDAEFALFRRMAEVSGRPLSFTLLQERRDVWRRQLELLAEANAAGVVMRAQVAPRAVGLLLGLECTLHPLLANPVYREVAALPLAERVAVMAAPAFRARVLEADSAPRSGAGRVLLGFDDMYELGDPPNYEPRHTDSVAERARREGRTPFDLAYDLLLTDGGRGMLYRPVLNYEDGNLDAAGEMLADDHSVVGLGDGGAHVGTICDASFPTTLLTLWGRDRGHGRLPIPFLVHRQTAATARTVGLLDRGVIAPGFRADLNLIDWDRLAARRPELQYDLPAGGKRFVQRADGYAATIAGGQVTYERGEATGAFPGRLIRGARPAPPPGGAQ
jgi:N-acyl-D-aspartate/D-glutamate deacylase